MERTTNTLSTGIRRQSFHFQLSHLLAVQRSGNGIPVYSNPTSSDVIMNKSVSSFVLPASLQPHYCRYMEDTFTCCTSAGKPQNFLSCMKGRHPNIKFIVQIQEPQSLTFLRLHLLIRTIFPFQYIENTVSGPGTNCNNLVNSSVINDFVSTPNFFISNGYPKYLFDNTLHKFLYNIFIKNITFWQPRESPFPGRQRNLQWTKIYTYPTSITHYLKTAAPQLLSFK